MLLLATIPVKTLKTSAKKLIDDKVAPAEDLELEISMISLEDLQKLIKKGYRFDSVEKGTITLAK